MEKYNHKLTDEQFLSTLIECRGLYTLTVKAIQQKYGITITRQSVRERAKKHPDIVEMISEEIVDKAERNIDAFLDDESHPDLRYKMTIYVMNNRGAERGYGKNAINAAQQEPDGYFEVGDKQIVF